MTAKQNMTAVIYDKRGRVISVGKNSYVKTHPLQKKFQSSVGTPYKEVLHAEIAALVKLKDWSRAEKIVVMRHMKDGTFGNAKPCQACERAIREAGIKFVEHT